MDKKNCKKIRIENKRRSAEEREYGFPSMFLWMENLTLRRIEVPNNINYHMSDDISDNKFYLVGTNGGWSVCKPYRHVYNSENDRYEWRFNTGWVTQSLGWIDILFEIEELVGYDDEPLGRLELPDEDDYCEECRGQCDIHGYY